MRFTKFSSLLLSAILLLSLCSCTKVERDPVDETESTDLSSNVESEITEENSIYAVNPLTGIEDLPKDKAGQKPVAVTVNNVSVAQGVQCGLGDADMIIETEVEGGITRLLSFYSNPTSDMERIGPIRSARVVFAELSSGFDAVLVHCGIDSGYCLPLVQQQGVVREEIWEGLYGARYSNGLPVEHTFYSSGSDLEALLADNGYNEGGTTEPYFNFTEEEAIPSGGDATNVTAKFNSGYSTDFLYDSATSCYKRAKNGISYKDYLSGEEETFKNVFILETSMSYYSDDLHRNINLTGGSGYYISNGGYEKILWSKGNINNPISFTTANGEELTVNAGNSYICIMNQATGAFIAE